ncbi:carboxypeptidase regulatory-like domain-containing protein [bacterium]|nr:carboxypeptidase regulatory-like domain-containing protein [bacterium]
MRLAGLLLCACALMIPAWGLAAASDPLPLGIVDYSQSASHLTVTRGTPEATTIALEVPHIVIEQRMVDYQPYQVFGIPGEPMRYTDGCPAIPHVTRFYRIPNTGNVELVVTAAEYELIEDIDAFPLQLEPGAFDRIVRNEAVYSKNGWYPAEVAEISAPMIMRDFRLVTVSLYPVQVNPVTRQARLYHNLQVDIVSTGGQGENELVSNHPISASFVPIYRSLIANLDESALDEISDSLGLYLIFTNTDVTAKKWADSLFVWKTRLGFPVRIEARSSWTPGQVSSVIQTAYQSSTRPEYVCLIGDPQWSVGIPHDGSNNDHTYERGNYGDEVPDIAVGRLSGNSGEMATINAKIMGYERNPYMGDTLWYRRGYFLAGVANECASNYTLMQWCAQMFATYTGVDSGTVESVNGHVNDSRVQQMFNRGISYFLWRGSWLNQMEGTIVNPMSNGWKLPVCMLITCAANDYTSGTGTAESYLIAGTASQPKGGVAAMGTSTYGTHNPHNITLAGGLMYGIANLGLEHLGNAFMYSKFWLFWTYNDGTPADFSRYFNLLGDPGLLFWTDVPVVMECAHPTTVSVGTRQVSIEAVRNDNGVPIADARVTLWKRGADSTYVKGMTDSEGRITLPVSINTTGDLLLTVSKKNHKPYLFTITCTAANQMAMLSSYTLDDDNSGGTSGNGNGIMNPSEVIDLPIYLKNFGTGSTATGISTTLTSRNPRVTVTQSSATYPNLAPGDSALGSQAFRISVSPAVQHQETALLIMTVTSSSGQVTGAIELRCVAGAVSYNSHSVIGGTFNPGTTRNLRVTLKNYGLQDLNSVTGRLVSLSPFVQVDDAQGAYGSIPAGSLQTNTTDEFTVSSNSLTFRGHQAPMMIVATATGGQTDTARFTLNVGTATTSDPTGPDVYGYFAYDNTDTQYEMSPTYQYVNISGGLGTNLNLNDEGEKVTVGQIWSTARRLPFRFKYYGVVYDTVTISANGWIAFGNQAWNDNFRNFLIPAMVAPEGMVAPYWDDLKTSGSGLGVWHYYDSANARYIVQWKANGACNTTPLDFEVILYDTTEHLTLDGNGKILFQYNQVAINFTGCGTNEPDNGCSMGIQAPRAVVGLSYLYGASYTPGSASLQSGRAVLFTTAAREMFGTIQGTVTDAGTGNPMPDVEITIDGFSYHTDTDDQGRYTIDNVLIGTYTVRASAYRYNEATVPEIVVALDSTSTANFSLTHPEISLSRDSIITTAERDPIIESFDIVNNGNGPLDYSILVYYAGDENPNPWDSVSGINLSALTSDYQIMGCEFVGDYWWVSGGGASGHNMLYKFALNGQLAGSIPQPTTTDVGWFDLAYDGELIYGSDGPNIVGIDEQGSIRRTIPSPMNPTRAVAYDPASRHFWVTDYTHDIFEIDTLGNILQQIENRGTGALAITGMAWNPTDVNGFKLYIFSQNGTSSFVRVTKMHPLSHVQQTVVDLPSLPGDRAGGCAITPAWNSTLLVFGAVLQNSTGDRLGIYEMAFNTTWINVTPSQFSVPGGGTRQVNIALNPEFLRPDLYPVNLHIASVTLDTTLVLPVRLTVLPSSVVEDEILPVLPSEYALQQNYPNPFNPVTSIRYDLRDPGHTKLVVYNLLGEQVAILVDGFQSAGRYQIAFDATSLPSGMYFYRLESGSFKQVHKMVLMK